MKPNLVLIIEVFLLRPYLGECIDYIPVSFLLPSTFDFAFDIARVALKSKLPEIHLKYALYLEDEVCVVTSQTGCGQYILSGQILRSRGRICEG